MRGRHAGRLAVLSALVALGALVVPATALAAPKDLLPDLRMAKPNDWHLTRENTSKGADRRLLRFTARILNLGRGPIIIRGERACATSACPTMDLHQRVRRSDGTSRVEPSEARARFDVGDGHNHWHVMRFERYLMVPLDAPPDQALASTRGSKVGFCFFDTNPHDRSLPGAPQSAVFRESGCGSKGTTKLRVGISVGWADLYGYYLPRQYFDTTGLPYGRYLVCNTADASGHWLESNESNNDSWAVIRLHKKNGRDRITVVDPGRRSPCAEQLPPPPAETGTWDLELPEAESVFLNASTRFVCVIGQPAARPPTAWSMPTVARGDVSVAGMRP